MVLNSPWQREPHPPLLPPPSRDGTPPPSPLPHCALAPRVCTAPRSRRNSLCAKNSGLPPRGARVDAEGGWRPRPGKLSPAPGRDAEREGRNPRPQPPEVPLGIRSHLHVSAAGVRPRGVGSRAGPNAHHGRARCRRFPPAFLTSAPSLPQPHQTAGKAPLAFGRILWLKLSQEPQFPHL